jgi:hypothetical protein
MTQCGRRGHSAMFDFTMHVAVTCPLFQGDARVDSPGG